MKSTFISILISACSYIYNALFTAKFFFLETRIYMRSNELLILIRHFGTGIQSLVRHEPLRMNIWEIWIQVQSYFTWWMPWLSTMSDVSVKFERCKVKKWYIWYTIHYQSTYKTTRPIRLAFRQYIMLCKISFGNTIFQPTLHHR